MLTMEQIENKIIHIARRMDDATDDYRDACNDAAEAEANYRRAQAVANIAVMEHGVNGEKVPANARSSYVDRHVDDERRAHLMADATRETIKQSLLTMRTQMEALRTLAATARYQTTG